MWEELASGVSSCFVNTQKDQLKARTKDLALRVIRLTKALPNRPEAWTISNQILRSATSVAANYRAACRARSRSEFAAKIGVVLEEADETAFWLELLVEAELFERSRIQALIAEASELVAIFAASSRTARTPILDKPGR